MTGYGRQIPLPPVFFPIVSGANVSGAKEKAAHQGGLSNISCCCNQVTTAEAA